MAPETKRRGDPILKALAKNLPRLTTKDPPLKRLIKGEAATGLAERSAAVHARRKGPLGLLQALGPGLITGASDDDPSGIGTYSQVGSQFGYGLLWTALFTSCSTIFRIFKYLTLALFAYVVTVFFVRPGVGAVITSTFIPRLELDPGFIAALVAVLGTTISPYLFFWQASSEVDEMKAAGQRTVAERRNVTRDELRAARTDILAGMGFSQVIMYCIILTTGTVLHAHGQTGVLTAQQAAQALAPVAGQFAYILFAAGLIGTGLLAIPILSGSAAYAIKELLGLHGSLAVRPRYRPTFYGVIVVATVVGLLFNLLRVDPIQMLFVTAMINGIVAPALLALIVLLGSDGAVMRDKRSGRLSRWLTWIATGAMSAAALGLVLSPLLSRA